MPSIRDLLKGDGYLKPLAEEDRKPAGKKKGSSYLHSEKAKKQPVRPSTTNDDDDPLYRDDGNDDQSTKEEKPFGNGFDLDDNDDLDDNEDDQDEEDRRAFIDRYSKAFEAIYGAQKPPSTAPVASASVAHSIENTHDTAADMQQHADAKSPSTVPFSSEKSALPTEEYLQKVQEAMVPLRPRPFAFVSKLENLRPKTKFSRHRMTTLRQATVETPEQAQMRWAKQKRRTEQTGIERRWKRRRFKYQVEEDFGNAMYNRAKRILSSKIRQEQAEQVRREEAQKAQAEKDRLENREKDRLQRRERREQRRRSSIMKASPQTQQHESDGEAIQFLASQQTESSLKSISRENDDAFIPDDSDDSVKEQQQVLNRLTQQTQDDSELDDADCNSRRRSSVGSSKSLSSKRDAIEDSGDPFSLKSMTDATESYQSRMDYWTYGRSAPLASELEINFVNSIPRFQPLPGKEGEPAEDPDADDDGLRMPVGRVITKLDADDEWESLLFDFPPKVKDPWYYHFRYIPILAARYLCGGIGEDPALEERLIRSMFSKIEPHKIDSLASFTLLRSIRRVAHQQGLSALTYAKSTWSDPLRVARLLGLHGVVGGKHCFLAGRSRKPDNVVSYFTGRRRRVLKKFRLKGRPWTYQRDSEDIQIDDLVDNQDIDGNNRDQNQIDNLNTDKEDDCKKPASKVNLNKQIRPDSASQEATNTRNITEEKRGESSQQEGNALRPENIKSSMVVGFTQKMSSGIIDLTEETDFDDRSHDDKSAYPKDRTEEQTSPMKEIQTILRSDKVTVDLQTRANTSKASLVSGRTIENPIRHGAVDEALLYPISGFAHIPGTLAPIPPFPLDATGIVYGPVDRHAKYYQQDSKMSHQMYQLTLSTLIARAAIDEEGTNKESAYEQIQSLLDDYIAATDSKIYRMQVQCSRGKLRDIPLVQHYHAIRSYCSVWANADPKFVPKSVEDVKIEAENIVSSEDDDDLYADDSDPSTINVCEIARQLSDFMEPRMEHNGLQRFSKLRVTYALANICRRLPVPAAEIIAQPLDNKKISTPLQIFRASVEYLENHNHIQEANDTGSYGLDTSMRSGELEYIFFDAAEMFQTCVEVDPTNLDNHLWRIGALATCLLLSSGNKIGSGARRYPSKLRRSRRSSFGGRIRDPKALKHEVREKLPKFDEVRMELAAALRLLFTLAQHQPGSRLDIAIVSLLEWHEMIALLAGDKLDSCIEEIDLMYEYHVWKKRVQEITTASPMSLSERKLGTVEILATELENDPGNIGKWRALARALGYFVSKPKSNEDDTHRDTCPECLLIRKPLVLDHQPLNRQSPTWWGSKRDWWVFGLLFTEGTKQLQRSNSPRIAKAVVEKLQENLSEFEWDFEWDIGAAKRSRMSNSPAYPYGDSDISWLPSRSERVVKVRSKEARAATYDSLLPSSKGSEDLEEDCIDPPPGLPKTETMEVLCYKIIICCHLKGVDFSAVEEQVYILIRSCWDSKRKCVRIDCDEFQVLQWLCSMGIDIPSLGLLSFSNSKWFK